MLSYIMPSILHWLMLPIPIFLMILSILYVSVFGISLTNKQSYNWQEDEIEREMIKMYRKRKLTQKAISDISYSEQLELEELECIHTQRLRQEDFV